MPDFGIFRGFNSKLFSDKLFAGQLPTQLGTIGSIVIPVFLLDAFPNAAAAYSLRKLRNAYTSSAIRVRNSSNSEADIGFAGTGLDTVSLLSHCGSGDGFVTTWYDQSGNARNATQTTAANQPQIVSSGNIININSKPSLKFDGSNDGFSVTLSGTSANLSVNKVEKWNSLTSGQLSTTFDPGLGPYLQWIQNTNNWANYYFSINPTLATTNQTLFAFYDGNGFYENNTLKVSKGTNSYPFTEFTIGCYSGNTLNANVNIQEMIIWTTQQVSNRTGISTNINSYYGIY